MQILFKGIEIYFSEHWNCGIGSVETRTALPFGVVYLLWSECHLTAYHGVVSVTVRTVKATCVEHTVKGNTSGKVQLMPAMGSGVFP